MYSLDAGKCKFLYSKIHQIMLRGIVQARKKADNVTCHMMRICNISKQDPSHYWEETREKIVCQAKIIIISCMGEDVNSKRESLICGERNIPHTM